MIRLALFLKREKMHSFTIPKINNYLGTGDKEIKIWCAEITGFDKKYIFARAFLKPYQETDTIVTFHVKENVPHHFKNSFGDDGYFLLPTEGKKKKLTINQVKMWLERQNIKEEGSKQRLKKIGFIFGRTTNACNVSK